MKCETRKNGDRDESDNMKRGIWGKSREDPEISATRKERERQSGEVKGRGRRVYWGEG